LARLREARNQPILGFPGSGGAAGRASGFRRLDVDIAIAWQSLAEKWRVVPRGLQASLQAVLCSPHFLFRWNSIRERAAGVARELNDYEIASRLSYFFGAASRRRAFCPRRQGQNCTKPEVASSRRSPAWSRMAHPGLVDNFGGQWLQIRTSGTWISTTTPSEMEGQPEGMMKEETERFLESVIKEDRPLTDLLDADYTFLNEELAATTASTV